MKIEDVPEDVGVYCLFNGKECQYVGSSIRMRSRIFSHKRRFAISHAQIYLCPEEQLIVLEQQWIDKLNPKFNKSRTASRRSINDENNNNLIVHLALPIDIKQSIRELAKDEQRPIVRMVRVLIREALIARGVKS